jgi:hypothetical protein
LGSVSGCGAGCGWLCPSGVCATAALKSRKTTVKHTRSWRIRKPHLRIIVEPPPVAVIIISETGLARNSAWVGCRKWGNAGGENPENLLLRFRKRGKPGKGFFSFVDHALCPVPEISD